MKSHNTIKSKSIVFPSRILEAELGGGDLADYVRIEIKSDRNAKSLFGYDSTIGQNYSIEEIETMAKNSDIHAQCAMGDYYSSEGKSFDPKMAMMWYEKAAMQGHAKAQGFFAGYCINGLGAEKDLEKAEFWAHKSAAQGSPTGMFVMSHCCIVKDDYINAVYWLEKADELGHPDVKPLLEMIRELKRQNVREEKEPSGDLPFKHEKDSYSENTNFEDNDFNPETTEDFFHEANNRFEKVFGMLQTIQRKYPKALLSSSTFKALASDLLRNDYDCKGIIRWLDISLFELNALPLLKDGIMSNNNFIRNNLINRLKKEGATAEMAKEVIAYLAVLVESEGQSDYWED